MAATPADRIFTVARPLPRVFEALPTAVPPPVVVLPRVFTVWPVERVFRVPAVPSRIFEV